MNIKTTIVLVVLILLGGAAWLGVTLLTPTGAASETLKVLESKFQPANITRIEFVRGERRVVLEKGADGWSLPGKWPVRKPEAEHLVGLLTSLHSRFAPVPAAGEEDLKQLGLAGSQVLHITVKADGQDYKLTFGEEPGQMSRFSRPTYVRLGNSTEALRVAPGLIAMLDRPQEYYMQRRLFPVERVAKEVGERTEHVEQLAAKEVSAKGPGESYTVVRAGDGWELREPVHDRVDPDKIKNILTSLPDVWVEKFVEPDSKKTLEDYGLKEPDDVLEVTRPQGDKITLLVGKTSDKRTRIAQKPGGAPFMQKPQIDVIEEEFKYAKLKENEQVFEIKADKLKDIVVAANSLRDPRLARFKTEDVKKLAIDEGGRSLSFVKEDAGWKLFQNDKAVFDVERNKVEEVLDKLSGMRADSKDISDKADPKTNGLDKPTTVRVTVEEGKDKEKKAKEFTFLLGKQEGGEKGKLHVQVAGWDRINTVDGDVLKLAQRPALAYRNRRVLNFSAFDAARVEVERTGEKYALEHANNKWRLATPQADLDPSKADNLPRELGQLEAVEFVATEPKTEDLDKVYGLAKPAATIKVAFTDKKKGEQTVEVGKKREGKDDYYARIGGDKAVFTIKKDVFETLTRDSLSLRPAELWKLEPENITEVRVRRGEEYVLQHQGETWKLSAPFIAPVAPDRIRPLTDELSHPKADKYVAHAAGDLAAYGLDNPYLRITVKPGARKDQDKDKEKDEKAKEAKERVLLVGKQVEKDGKARFARLGDSEAIFVLGEKAVSAVDQSALELLDRKLLAIRSSDIKSIRTAAGKDTFTLARDKEGWKVERSDGPAFNADPDIADDAVLLWGRLMAQKVVAYGDKVELAKFGLDKPASTITVTASEKIDKDKVDKENAGKGKADKGKGEPGKGETGKDDQDKAGKTVEHKLILGDEVKDAKGARYARVEGNPAVAVLDAPVVAELQRTPLDFVQRSVLKLDAAKVNGLTRKLGSDTVELVKKDDHWRIIKPAEQPADDTILRNLTGELAGLRAKKVAAYPAKDLKAFGLDAPAAVVTLRVDDGMGKSSEHVLQVGKLVEEKGSGDRYARLEKSDTVVIVPARLAEQMLAAPLGFRDRLLAKVPAVGKLLLERGVRKATFANKDGEWKMTQPIEADAERVDLEELIRDFAELRADKLVAEKAGDLKPYGLDRPQAQLQLFAADGAKEALRLLVGSKEKDGKRVYVKLAGGDVVALLDEKLSGQVLAEYRSRKVWPALDSFQVDKLTFGYEKGAFTLQKLGSDWQVAGKSDKVKADTVRDTLDALSRLKAEQWVVDRDADLKLFGLEPPFLTLEVDTGTAKRTLKLGRQEGGTGRYYATIVGENSGAVFIIGERDGQAIARPLQAFLAGKS
jgi:hypothetical protein